MIKYYLLIILLTFSTSMAQNQKLKTGDLFYDDFLTEESKWTDMAVWGFGVWQKKNGSFVSLNPADSSKNIFAAIPNFENAIVNRDYSIIFRYKPVSGSSYQFSIQVRQQGLNNYKVDFSKDGKISIIKTVSGKLPFTLFQSKSDQILFNQWQWIRVIVLGDSPLAIKCKSWTGELSQEPVYYNAVSLDKNPLKAENMNVALTSIQEGGAYSEIDEFHVFSSIPTSEYWYWQNSKMVSSDDLNISQSDFKSGNLYTAEVMLKKLNEKYQNDEAVNNNLAVLYAEKGQFNKAYKFIEKALIINRGKI